MSNDNKTGYSLDKFLFWAFIAVSVFFSLTILSIIIPRFCPDKVNRVEISIAPSALSSNADSLYGDSVSKMMSIAEHLSVQSDLIEHKYGLLIKEKEQESDIFKLVACIAAFITALLGFLGYRTIKDIEDRAILAAKQKTDDELEKLKNRLSIIQKEFLSENLSDSALRSSIKTEIEKDFLTKEINDINSYIEKVAKRLEDVKAIVDLRKIVKEEEEQVPTDDSSEPEFGAALPGDMYDELMKGDQE